MDNLDLDVLQSAVRWLDEGRCALLVTVVRTWGSAPRPAGSMLAIRDDGCVAGSVSGGCIEDDLIERVKREGIAQRLPEVTKYGVTAQEAHRFGLPCGGTLELALEPLAPFDSGLPAGSIKPSGAFDAPASASPSVSNASSTRGKADELRALLEAIAQGRLLARTLDMTTGIASLGTARATDGLHFDGRTLVTIHGPRYRLLVIGAGQLSRYLSQIAVGLGYQVVVCDPRDEYAQDWDIPGTTLVRAMPDDTVLDMRLDERCAVVTLTHDPKLDDLALMEALKTRAFYVGALGSRRNNAARRTRLREFDLSDAELARMRGPAGIYIGSRTPPEIAISILAEMTAAKNGVSLPDMLRVEGAKAGREREAATGAG